MATTITQRLQFDIPYDIYLRLRRHPDFPGWRGRNKFFCQMMTEQVNSPAFRLKELEYENRCLRRERDEKGRSAEFWKARAGGNPFAPKPNPGPPAPPVPQGETNAA